MKFRVEYINKLKIAITLVYIMLIAFLGFFFKDIFGFFEEKFIDFRSIVSYKSGLYSNRFKPADNNIVIISLDELSQYEAAHSTELNLRTWPWSRVVWARLINFIEKQSPKVVIVDLNFSNYEDLSRNYSSPDMVLADTLAYYDNIVLSTALRTPYSESSNLNVSNIIDNYDNPYSPTRASFNISIDNPNIERNISYFSHAPIPSIFTNSALMGVTNLPVLNDKNTKVSYSQPIYKLVKGNKEYFIPSIALATLIKYKNLESESNSMAIENGVLKLGQHRIRVDENGCTLINWQGDGREYIDIPITSILLSMVRGDNLFEYKKQKYPLSFFKDKIVLITQTHLNSETHNTPVAPSVTDAQIKANIIDNYINDSDLENPYRKMFVKHIKPYKGYIITVLFCLTILFVNLISTNMTLAFFNGLLTIVAYIVFAILLFIHPKLKILVDMAEPLFYICSTFLITFVMKSHHEIKKRRRIERIFGNLVSEKVLKQLVDKPHRLNLKSSIQNVTVMSCRINNEIDLTEKISPEKYVKLVNQAFNTIEDVIFKYNGTINKFVGNSVLVYWGYPIHSRKDSENAIRAAIEIKEKIDTFNQTHLTEIIWDRIDEDDNLLDISESVRHQIIDVKLAINTGSVLIGRMGSSNASDLTVIGETVDALENIEKICTEFNKDIVLTQNTLDCVNADIPVNYIGQFKLKNNPEKIKIYELDYMN